MFKKILSIAIALSALAPAAHAAPSLPVVSVIGRYFGIDPSNDAGLFAFYSEANSLAQTFTVPNRVYLDALDLRHSPTQAPTSITLAFYELTSQDSPIGTLMAQAQVTLDAPLSHIDVSGMNLLLQPNKSYSFVVSSDAKASQPNLLTYDSGYYAAYDIYNDAYAGGLLWSNQSGSWQPLADMFSGGRLGISDAIFSLYGTRAAIPEPATPALFGLGLACLFFAKRSASSFRG